MAFRPRKTPALSLLFPSFCPFVLPPSAPAPARTEPPPPPIPHSSFSILHYAFSIPPFPTFHFSLFAFHCAAPCTAPPTPTPDLIRATMALVESPSVIGASTTFPPAASTASRPLT